MNLLDNMGTAALPVTIHSAEGALCWDTDGRQYWDFYGGHAVTFLGQAHPRWVSAITKQATQLSFFTTLGPVPVRTEAAAKLCSVTNMDRVFFVSSGAEANEAALKLARKATGRGIIIAMEHGFHGRTMGALGATWKYRDQHAHAHGPTRFVPYGDLEALEAALDEDVAAIIAEPIQGIAGIVEPPSGWLQAIRDLATANGSLLIMDEIQSGMGRTGEWLASQAAGVKGDIVTVGKGLGNGFPVAACCMTEAVASTASPGEHGTTFGGAPMACAAALETMQIIEDEGLLQRAQLVGQTLWQAIGGIDGVVEVRGRGAWIGVVLNDRAAPVKHALLAKGYLLGTASDPHVLRLAPPAKIPLWACQQLAADLATVLAEMKGLAA